MVIKFFKIVISCVSLLFVPISPLAILTTLTIFKDKNARDYTKEIPTKFKAILVFLITASIAVVCTFISESILPYSEFYPSLVISFFRVLGILSLYLSIIDFCFIKNRDN